MAYRRPAASRDGHEEVEALERAIVKLDVEVKAAIDDLHEAKVGDHAQLAKALAKPRELMRDLDRQINRLEVVAEKVGKTEDRAQLSRLVASHRSAAERNTGWLRRETQRLLATMEADAREALLGGEEEGSGRKVRGVGGSMAEEAARTTAGLGGLLSRMGEQVDASTAALNTLLTSSSLLKETEDEFATMGAAISASGKLLSKWERREITDKILFILAILLFYVTAAYIVRKRLGALWIFSWI